MSQQVPPNYREICMSEQNQNGLNSQARSELFPETQRTYLMAALEGDNERQAWFYRRYATPIYCFLKKRGMTRDEAKDLTHDIVVKFLENKFENYNFKTPFRSYLIAVMENEVKSFKKKKTMIAKKTSEFIEEIISEAERIECFGDASAEEIFEERYAQQLFEEALRKVKLTFLNDTRNQNRWDMFYARFYENLSWPQIAEKYGYTRDRARNLTLVVIAKLGHTLYEEFKKEGIDDKQVKIELRDLMLILSKHK